MKMNLEQLLFPSETLVGSGRLCKLWPNLVPSDGELQAFPRLVHELSCIASAKCILVTRSLQECPRGYGV